MSALPPFGRQPRSRSDGTITGVVDELDLIENAETKEGCAAALLSAMKEYAQDFYSEFKLWAAAPNRKAHIPYILKILSSSDARIMEDMVCRDRVSQEYFNSKI